MRQAPSWTVAILAIEPRLRVTAAALRTVVLPLRLSAPAADVVVPKGHATVTVVGAGGRSKTCR
jgi:hypothetical protein